MSYQLELEEAKIGLQSFSSNEILEFETESSHLDEVDLIAAKIRYVRFKKNDTNNLNNFKSLMIRQAKIGLSLCVCGFFSAIIFSSASVERCVLLFATLFIVGMLCSILPTRSYTGCDLKSSSVTSAIFAILANKSAGSSMYDEDLEFAKKILALDTLQT